VPEARHFRGNRQLPLLQRPTPSARADARWRQGNPVPTLACKEWNLNPQAVVAAGGSSGAGISLWIGFHDDLADPTSADPVQRQSTRISAIGSVDTALKSAYAAILCDQGVQTK
jgi:hypothetical protein